MTAPRSQSRFDRWKLLFARPGAREAAGNFAWLATDKFVRFGLTHVVAFWMARHLGPDCFGVLVFFIAVVGLTQPFVELGFEAILRREFIRSPETASILAGTARQLRFFSGSVVATLIALSTFFGWATPAERPLVWVLVLSCWSPALGIGETWLQARLAAHGIVIAQWMALAIAALVRAILILGNAGLFAFAAIAATETLVAGLLISLPAQRRGLRYGRFDWKVGRSLLREAWPLMLSGVAAVMYLRLDAVMIRVIRNETEVGVYAAATRFAEIWFFVPTALAASLLPALLRRGTGDTKSWQAFFDLNAAFGYAIAGATAVFSGSLINLAYGPHYAPATAILTVYAWSLPLIFIGVARTQALVSDGYTGFYLGATTAGLVINVLLNLVLIPRHGAWGAALATVAAQLLAAWLSSFLFLPLRRVAWMQTRALLIPARWFYYVRGIS